MALQLTGTVLNFWTKEGMLDQSTNTRAESQHRVQIMYPDEKGKMLMEDLRVHETKDWEGLEQKHVKIDVQMYHVEGNAGLFVPRGVKPQIIKA